MPSRSSHHLYVISAPEVGRIKVGTAASPRARLRVLQTGSPVRLVLVAVAPNAGYWERKIHRELAHLRADGAGTEWFDASAHDVAEALEHLAVVEPDRLPARLVWRL